VKYFDQYLQPINEGDFVAFPLALGNVVRGQVVKLDSGLSLSRNPNEPPQSIAHVLIMLDLQAAPNGVVVGIIKAERPPDAPRQAQPAEQKMATSQEPPVAGGPPPEDLHVLGRIIDGN